MGGPTSLSAQHENCLTGPENPLDIFKSVFRQNDIIQFFRGKVERHVGPYLAFSSDGRTVASLWIRDFHSGILDGFNRTITPVLALSAYNGTSWTFFRRVMLSELATGITSVSPIGTPMITISDRDYFAVSLQEKTFVQTKQRSFVLEGQSLVQLAFGENNASILVNGTEIRLGAEMPATVDLERISERDLPTSQQRNEYRKWVMWKGRAILCFPNTPFHGMHTEAIWRDCLATLYGAGHVAIVTIDASGETYMGT